MLCFLCIAAEIHPVTLVTVVTFEARVTYAGACNTQATTPTLGIHTLTTGHVTFNPFPSAVALTAPTVVLPIAAAQHWTRR